MQQIQVYVFPCCHFVETTSKPHFRRHLLQLTSSGAVMKADICVEYNTALGLVPQCGKSKSVSTLLDNDICLSQQDASKYMLVNNKSTHLAFTLHLHGHLRNNSI